MLQPNIWNQFWWLLPLLLSILGLFFSLWIVVSAPTFFLLPLGVCVPELSPWLLIINAIALVLAIIVNKGWLSDLMLVCSSIGLSLSLIPLLQIPATNQRFEQEMERALGKDYLHNIPQDLQSQMRPRPFVLADVFRGISSQEVRIDRGIVFASPDGVDLKLNVYRPLQTGKYPALIVIYGGAWKSGNPDRHERFSCYMAAREYTVITIDYRHAPEYKFPRQLEDVKTALQYIRGRAADLEIDLDKMAIMGRSAGGHLATLAAYQNAIPWQAIISYYGPVDLVQGYYDLPEPDPIDIQDVLEDFSGGTPEELPKLYRQDSPINYLKPNLPPSLLVYSSRDRLVQAKFGRELYDKLIEFDNTAILLEIPWAEHAFDAVFFGVSNQLVLYYTERFLAFSLKTAKS